MAFIFLRFAMPEIKSPFPRNKVSMRKYISTKILLKSLLYAFAIFGLLFVMLLFAVSGLIAGGRQSPKMPSDAILTIDFDGFYGEIVRDNLLTEVTAINPMSFQDLLKAISYASVDERVKAIAARISYSNLGLAQTEELRHAIKQFRERGKKAYIFAPGFGNMGGGTSEYHLATAFSEITMMPNTDLWLTGVALEVPFFRGALDKIGITPEFFTRYEYKNAMASFTDKKGSKEFAYNMDALLTRLNGNILFETLSSRLEKHNSDLMMEILDGAPYMAEKAKELKLIDNIAYESDWLERIQNEHNGKLIDVMSYMSNIYPVRNGKKIAVLVLEGALSDISGAAGFADGEITSAQVLEQIDEIRQDKDVIGVLVRVNSPGGSYNAANEIWYGLNKLKKDKKIPLVVSMGDYAASGGYFVSLAGDKIFADKNTITGSIGVLGGKFALPKLWEKLGVSWKQFGFTQTAGISSPNFMFNKTQKLAINKLLDNVYKDFTLKVSQARNIPIKELDKLARGRVFPGSVAVDVGLVDSVGGFETALNFVAGSAGLKQDDKFVLDVYPRPRSLQQKIAELISGSPIITTQKLKTELGLDIKGINVLKLWQYDAVLPLIIND